MRELLAHFRSHCIVAGTMLLCIAGEVWGTGPVGGQDTQPGSVDQARNVPPAAQPATLAPPGTEDDADGRGGRPVYSDLPASMMLNADLDPVEGRPIPEQLLGRFIDRHSAMDYSAAAELALQLVDVSPDRPIAHYNMACVMAKLNRPEAAIAALNRAVDCGWRSVSHMTLDADLQSLRDTSAFKAVIEKMQARISEEKITAGPLRNDELQQVVSDLEERIPDLLKRYHVPGVTLAIVRDGRVVWQSAHGVCGAASDANGVPIAENTLFRVREPMQLLALLGGAIQQQRGVMQLAEVLRQGAEIDRMDQFAQRGTSRRSRTDTEIRPVSKSVGIAAEDPMSKPNGRSVVRSGSAAYGLLRLAIEMTSSQEFAPYCTSNIFERYDLVGTRFAAPAESDIARMAIGHTPLGTAVARHCPGEDRAVGGCLYTTAQDMGRLIQTMLESSPQANSRATDAAGSPPLVDPIDELARMSAEAPGSTLMSVRIDAIKDLGRRITVLDRTDGQGCLLRWYPANRSGIAVMFNSATGAEAAERIAHIALGGQ